MNVPASRVVTLFVDAFTPNWNKYTVQFETELGPMMLVLHIRDASTTQTIWTTKQEEIEREILKEEERDLPVSTLHATAKPSIVLAHRVVPGSRLEGPLPPIHTYSIRHVNEGDFEDNFERKLEENIRVKRRKL